MRQCHNGNDTYEADFLKRVYCNTTVEGKVKRGRTKVNRVAYEIFFLFLASMASNFSNFFFHWYLDNEAELGNFFDAAF